MSFGFASSNQIDKRNFKFKISTKGKEREEIQGDCRGNGRLGDGPLRIRIVGTFE